MVLRNINNVKYLQWWNKLNRWMKLNNNGTVIELKLLFVCPSYDLVMGWSTAVSGLHFLVILIYNDNGKFDWDNKQSSIPLV